MLVTPTNYTIVTVTEYFQQLKQFDQAYLVIIVGAVAALALFRRLPPLRLPQLPLLRLPVGVLVVLAVLMTTFHLMSSFWYDEAFTGVTARVPFDQLHRVILADVHPPVAYLPFWATGHLLGYSDIGLRIPSLVAFFIAAFLLNDLARNLGYRSNTAVTIFVLMPSLAWYATESRSYMILLCLVLITWRGLILDKPLYLMFGTLAAFASSHGYIWLFIACLTGLIHYKDRRWLTWSIISSVVASIWIPFLLMQSGDVADGFWIQDIRPGGVLSFISDMSLGHRVPDLAGVVVIFLTWCMTIYSFIFWWRDTTIPKLIHLSMFAAPVLLAAISVLWHPVYLPRALLGSIAGLIIIWAYTLERKPVSRWIFYPALLLVLIYHNSPDQQKPMLRGGFDGCQIIYTLSPVTAITAKHYAPDGTEVWIWTEANDINQTLPDSAKVAMGLVINNFDELPSLEDVCIYHLWNPYTANQEQHLTDILSSTAHYKTVLSEKSYGRMAVYRFYD